MAFVELSFLMDPGKVPDRSILRSLASASTGNILRYRDSRSVEKTKMIFSAIAILIFLFSLLVIARTMGVTWRMALVFQALSFTTGLLSFSVVTAIPQLSAQTLNNLEPAVAVAVMPFVVTFELLTGTFLSSKILGQDFLRFLRLTVTSWAVAGALSFPLLLLLAT